MIPRVFITAACAVLVYAVACNGLERDCSNVECSGKKPICEEGEIVATLPDECCPVCSRPNCIGILCVALSEEFDCQEGEILVVPPGECCARCVSSCFSETCQKPLCHKGETPQVPEGQCCPVCVRNADDCDGECPAGHRCAIDKVTNQKYCSPDCKLDNGGCRADQVCSLEVVNCIQAPCPPQVRCFYQPAPSKE